MSRPLAAILAGGRSRRFGSPKALATVGGVPIVERVLGVLDRVAADPVLIAGDDSPYASLALRRRPDVVPGAGPLAGIHAALGWARDEARPGILAVACDMPFASAALLRRLLDEAALPDRPDAVVPGSDGPRGCEPLFAYYAVSCLPAVEAQLRRGQRHLVGFHEAVRVRHVPVADVRSYGDPEVLFLNVNSPGDRERAERIAGAPAGAPAGPLPDTDTGRGDGLT